MDLVFDFEAAVLLAVVINFFEDVCFVACEDIFYDSQVTNRYRQLFDLQDFSLYLDILSNCIESSFTEVIPAGHVSDSRVNSVRVDGLTPLIGLYLLGLSLVI